MGDSSTILTMKRTLTLITTETSVGGNWQASPFGGGTFKKGLTPKDFAIRNQE